MADNLDRQRNELALLESMYPGDVDINRPPSAADAEADIDVRIDAHRSLSFTLASSYPSAAPPHVFLDCAHHVSNAERKALRRILAAIVDRQPPDTECIDLIVADFRAELDSLVSPADEQHQHQHQQPQEPSSAGSADIQGLRVVLWMHHLLATGKRKAIVQLSKELHLAGFSKPGYPGAVYVEGRADAVTAFVEDLKSMRWQAIQERVTDHVPLQSLTLAGTTASSGIQEVQSLGDVAEGLRSSGDAGPAIADLFLQGMKIK